MAACCLTINKHTHFHDAICVPLTYARQRWQLPRYVKTKAHLSHTSSATEPYEQPRSQSSTRHHSYHHCQRVQKQTHRSITCSPSDTSVNNRDSETRRSNKSNRQKNQNQKTNKNMMNGAGCLTIVQFRPRLRAETLVHQAGSGVINVCVL